MAKGIARLGILFSSLLVITDVQAVMVGDLPISGIMVNPAAVSDRRGEWFELYNPTDDDINLRDIIIGDDGDDSHKIETDLLILPGHFLTLADRGDSAAYGGPGADYTCDNFSPGNPDVEISLNCSQCELLHVEYGSDCYLSHRSRVFDVLPMNPKNCVLRQSSLICSCGSIETLYVPGRIRLT